MELGRASVTELKVGLVQLCAGSGAGHEPRWTSPILSSEMC